MAASLLAVTSHAGHSTSLTLALFLLGLGWSCTPIAGLSMLTAALPLTERPAAQGVGDVAMGLAGGGGGALAGVVAEVRGYPALALAAGGVAVMVGLSLPMIRLRRC